MIWSNGGKGGDTDLCRMAPTTIGNFFILLSNTKIKKNLQPNAIF
jgi:hypothetical protein